MGKGRQQKYGATNVVNQAISQMNVAPHPRHPEQQIDPNPLTPGKEKERETKEMGKVRKEREIKEKEKTKNAKSVVWKTTKQQIAGTKPQYVKDITRMTAIQQTVRSIIQQFAHSGSQVPAKRQIACSSTETAPGPSPGQLLPHLMRTQDQTHHHPLSIRTLRKRSTRQLKKLRWREQKRRRS